MKIIICLISIICAFVFWIFENKYKDTPLEVIFFALEMLSLAPLFFT